MMTLNCRPNSNLKQALLLVVVFLSGISAFANPYVTFEKQYAELARLANQTDYVYRLSPQQIAEAYDVKDQRALLNELIEKISYAGGNGGYDQAVAREDFNDKYVTPRVKHILSMSKAQINLAIMTLSRDHILNDDRRLAAQLLLSGIGEAKFSQAELDRLAEEDTAGHQAVTGVKWGTGVVATIGLFLGARKHGPGILPGLKNIWRATPKVAANVKEKAKAVTQLTLHEAMQMARQSGLRFASDLGTNVVEIVTRRNKLSRLKAWGVNFAKSEAFSDMAWVALGQGVGAGSKTGYHYLHKAFFKENMKNGIVNPNAIRDEYFDGLTVLRLSCQVKELFPKTFALTKKPVSAASAAELKGMYKTLLNSYADYMYLKGATGRFITPTPLSANIKHDIATGRVSFKAKIRGETQEFGFDCPALKGVNTHGRRLEVSFGEMLDELTGSFLNLETVFFKYQK